MLTERLTRAVKDALAVCRAEDLVPDVGVPVEVVAQAGAYASNAPLLLARRAENTTTAPTVRAAVYAEALAENINAHTNAPCHAAAQSTGNLLLTPSPGAYADTLRAVLDAGETLGKNTSGANARALVEYVSANPNTPLSLHHARGAAIGDAVAGLLAASGYAVEREFYVNDSASAPQMRTLARAVFAKYRETFGTGGGDGDESYTGEYVASLAAKVAESSGDRYADLSPEAAATALAPALLALMQAEQAATLARFGTTFDRWFSESALLATGALQNALDNLLASGAAYAHGGALWLKTSRYGDDGDRVLLRNDGTPSYFAGDLAYHADKLQARAYDVAVDVWNADHQSYIGRTAAGLAALGVRDAERRLKTAVFGGVRPLQDGTPLQTGRHAGGIVSLREILDAGADVPTLRFVLLLASPSQSVTDLNVNTLSPNAPGNPLAPIHAVIARANGAPGSDFDAATLAETPDLCAVVRRLDQFGATVKSAAITAAPGEVARYAYALADAVTRLPQVHDDAATGATVRASGAVLVAALRILAVDTDK